MDKIWFLYPVSVSLLLVHYYFMCCLAVTNRTTDQSALLAFKDHITFDPHNILLHNWSTNGTSFCSWIGVTCNARHHRVTALHLPNMGLTGTISPHIGKLSFLVSLDITNNSFHGHLPEELGLLRRLKLIRLGYNNLTGELPPWFGNLTKLQLLYLHGNQFYGQILGGIWKCTQLQNLSLSGNRLTGTIPGGIGNLIMLKSLYLSDNNLEGVIPEEMGNLVDLEILDLSNNSLSGIIPREIGNLTMIKEIYLGRNNLKGPIPFFLFNISTTKTISLQFNNLSGQLPSNIGLLPNLEELYLANNRLGGVIPSSLSNASELTTLELSSNSFTGSLPNALGNLRLLEWLNVGDNILTTEFSSLNQSFLTFLTNCKYLKYVILSNNPLDWVLPISIGNLSASLEGFYAYNSKIRGIMPREIGNLTSLIALSLYNNELTGFIPTTIGSLHNLQGLYLMGNRLHGSIPYDLCHLKSLSILRLDGNNLSGSIPTCVDNLTSLRLFHLGSNKLTSIIPSSLWSLTNILQLNFSTNCLSGSLPVDIGNVKVVTEIDLSRNKLSGEIPSVVGSLQNLVSLFLADNGLQGPIPQSFGSLISLAFLDISNNNLSGVIPKSLEALLHLKTINLSLNKLEGEIPNGGPFANFSAQSFIMNHALCGEARLQVPPCKTDTLQRSKATTGILLKYILAGIALTVVVVVVALILLLICCRKRHVKFPAYADLEPLAWRRISYYELLQATNEFCESNLLGMGSFSSVYRGILLDGVCVAVKVFNLQREGAFKSFEAECEVLRNIRHRNLIKIISSCSNINFKSLILEYMPNGSLEKWLYSFNYCLDTVQRLNIMIDVASALEYLHHGYSTIVVHCDLKPNNVLLDEDMVAHVGDFGIAKLLGEEEFVINTKTLATIGYMAPEYGLEGIASPRSDVYSYGILVLETFTRKKPTDKMFVGEFSLKSWVKELIPHGLAEVVDANLLMRENEKNCISSILKLALNCAVDVPEDRMDIRDILATLNIIKIGLQTSTTF